VDPKILFYISVNFQRFLLATILFACPVLVVLAVKQTSWGPILAAPKARQTGDPQAKVTIVEYSDFQCPSCASVDPTIHQYLEIYKGKIRLIYKYYPLVRIHKNAMASAHAADCAASQDHFWPYHDRLFQTQLSWAGLQNPTTSFMAIAEEVKLDMPKFQTCYADPSRIKVIEQDAQEAQAHQITATPTFMIGDDRLVGQVVVTDGARTIEKALRR
jgi:protein-disulfide isomerase